jgi:hypothetical protein
MSVEYVLRDLEKIIPEYYTKAIDENFVGIYNKRNNKLVSVVSSEYKFIQSKDLFKEVLLSLRDYNFVKHTIKTNYKTHYLYLRAEIPGYTNKLMLILVNSVDRSNAVKFLVGVYELKCANDLIITHWFYFKHIGQTEEKLKAIKIMPERIIAEYEALKGIPNQLTEESIKRLRKVIYIDEKIAKTILQQSSLYDVYNYITSQMSKKYNIAYFQKLNYLYNFLIKA